MYASDQTQAQVVLGKRIRDIFEIVDIDRRRGGRGGRQDKRSRESEERQKLKRSKKRVTKPTREARVQDGILRLVQFGSSTVERGRQRSCLVEMLTNERKWDQTKRRK